TVGYGLWALELAGRTSDSVTEAMVEYLLQTQRPDGHWITQGRRPPLEESLVTATALSAVRAKKYATAAQRTRARAANGPARQWLLAASVQNQEDRNHKLWGLRELGADKTTLARARSDVVAAQHDDGGWSARDELPSDAYATGQTLARLYTDGVAATDPAYA